MAAPTPPERCALSATVGAVLQHDRKALRRKRWLLDYAARRCTLQFVAWFPPLPQRRCSTEMRVWKKSARSACLAWAKGLFTSTTRLGNTRVGSRPSPTTASSTRGAVVGLPRKELGSYSCTRQSDAVSYFYYTTRRYDFSPFSPSSSFLFSFFFARHPSTAYKTEPTRSGEGLIVLLYRATTCGDTPASD